MTVFLNQPCDTLRGVGPALSKKLKQCGILSLRDLILHLPYRYQDRTHITPIRDIRPQQWTVIVGYLESVEILRAPRKMLRCVIQDHSGSFIVRFFHFHPQQLLQFQARPRLRLFGEIRRYRDQLEMVHPEYQILNEDSVCLMEETLTPIYATTEGLRQTRLRQLITQALDDHDTTLDTFEWLPHDTRDSLKLPTFKEALHTLHHPAHDLSPQALEHGSHPSLKRLALDEMVAKKISMQWAKQQWKIRTAPAIEGNATLIQTFIDQLPFTLTGAQHRVYQEIREDLKQPRPMLRLLQGDVGAGKTMIAALTALEVISAGYQVALMAPTELLSEQHAQTLTQWFQPFHIPVFRLTGSLKQSERQTIQQHLAYEGPSIVVGTHALFQEPIQFRALGCIIIDEQHRFGVEQRFMLQQKGQTEAYTPHQLMMTATPIPRTLAMTQWAHLDLSILDELPQGRRPILTTVMHQNKRTALIQRLEKQLSEKKQVYWVCPLIDESEHMACMAANKTAEYLIQALPKARIGLVHGRLKSAEKESIMQKFKQGALDLLVATTVIEVGVDVPNASLMIIENAERLGLSQLHQLRGRVGRGTIESHCVLLYQEPLSQTAKSRLQLMRKTHDGFLIAEKDLAMRGSGQLLGTQQTGYRPYKIAVFPRDQDLLETASSMALHILQHHPLLAETIVSRWFQSCEHFFQV